RTSCTCAGEASCARALVRARSRQSPREATSPRCCRDGCRRRSSREHLDERVHVVGTAIHGSVHEERGRPPPLRGKAALNVAANAREDCPTDSIHVEAFEVEPEIPCIAPEVLVLERSLSMEKGVVHLPEPVLFCRCFRGGGGGQRLRMGVGQTEGGAT